MDCNEKVYYTINIYICNYCFCNDTIIHHRKCFQGKCE